MNHDWLATEHHRLHVVENWPDGPRKDAVLKAVRSSLASLLQTVGAGDASVCSVCLAQRQRSGILEFPSAVQSNVESTNIAA